jgi:hypothetical protein
VFKGSFYIYTYVELLYLIFYLFIFRAFLVFIFAYISFAFTSLKLLGAPSQYVMLVSHSSQPRLLLTLFPPGHFHRQEIEPLSVIAIHHRLHLVCLFLYL